MMIVNGSQKMTEELWKVIPNFPKYEASNFGRIRSIKTKRILSFCEKQNNGKYLNAILYKDQRRYSVRVHRMVLFAFKGIDTKDVNHKDGNKQNNNINNLEYCTKEENMRHAWNTGLCKKQLGEETSIAKLTEKDILEIRGLLSLEINQYTIAKTFNVNQSTISRIKSKHNWSHI
jgi:hypothetical protein